MASNPFCCSIRPGITLPVIGRMLSIVTLDGPMARRTGPAARPEWSAGPSAPGRDA